MLAFQCYNECEFLYAYPDGKVKAERIRLNRLFWGEIQDHPGEQWLIEGQDLGNGDIKEFALKDILVPTTEQQPKKNFWQGAADSQIPDDEFMARYARPPGDGDGRKQDDS